MGSKHWQQRLLLTVTGPQLGKPDALPHLELLLRPAVAITTLGLAELQQRLRRTQALEHLPAFELQRVLRAMRPPFLKPVSLGVCIARLVRVWAFSARV